MTRAGAEGSAYDQGSGNKQLAVIIDLHQLTACIFFTNFPSWAIESIDCPLCCALGTETASWVVLLYRIPRPRGHGSSRGLESRILCPYPYYIQ